MNNDFGWKLNDVVGAQIVGAPAQVAQNRVLATQNAIMVWSASVFAALWALINGLVYVFYKRGEFISPVTPATTSPA